MTGFPSLLFFEKGEFQFKYNGPREKDAIVKFMLDPNPAFSEDAKNEESEKDEILMGLPEEVTVLNHKNFEEFVEENKEVIVYFYAPWCGVCKGAKPSFFEAAELLADEGTVDDNFFCDLTPKEVLLTSAHSPLRDVTSTQGTLLSKLPPKSAISTQIRLFDTSLRQKSVTSTQIYHFDMLNRYLSPRQISVIAIRHLDDFFVFFLLSFLTFFSILSTLLVRVKCRSDGCRSDFSK